MINFQSDFHSKRPAIRDSGPPYSAIRDPKVSKPKNSPHAAGGGHHKRVHADHGIPRNSLIAQPWGSATVHDLNFRRLTV